MEQIVEELVALAEDKGTHVIDSDSVIAEYVTANMSTLIDEIRQEVICEINVRKAMDKIWVVYLEIKSMKKTD